MKNHEVGGKIASSHTTFIDLAGRMVKLVKDRSEVTKISSGYITSGSRGTGGGQKIKICDIPTGILLKCRQNTSSQEIRIWTNNPHLTKLTLARGARDKGVRISFGHADE